MGHATAGGDDGEVIPMVLKTSPMVYELHRFLVCLLNLLLDINNRATLCPVFRAFLRTTFFCTTYVLLVLWRMFYMESLLINVLNG